MSTFAQLLSNAIDTLSPITGESASFEARILLCQAFNITNEKLLVNLHNEADEAKVSQFNTLIQKRSNHTPLQYILGKWEFMGLPFFVRENVLIPRADTETLVLHALELTKSKTSFSLLDMCCGSGCIGLSIKKLSKANVNLTLADISDDALSLSKENAKELNTEANFVKTDIFQNINEKFDIIVCNPPYIRTADLKTLDKEVQNEPMLALDGGIDGLDIYKKIESEYSDYLNDNGVLLLEIGFDMASDITSLFGGGYVLCDLCKNDRVVVVNKK